MYLKIHDTRYVRVVALQLHVTVINPNPNPKNPGS